MRGAGRMNARYEQQRARADLTPIAPAPGTWAVESTWVPIAPELAAEAPLVLTWPDEAAAEREGLSLACCAGALTVRVAAPDGTIRHSWDREGNFWLTH